MNKITITSKVKSNKFKAIENATIKDLSDALYLEAELIMTDSKTNYVPVVSGNLRNTGTVLKPVWKGKTIEVVLGYGGSAAEYAAVVHEYPPTYGQGKNKYLAKPLNKAERGMAKRLADAVRAKAGRIK